MDYYQYKIKKEIKPYLDYPPEDRVNKIEFGKTRLEGVGSK
jgi:hypothetical protein